MRRLRWCAAYLLLAAGLALLIYRASHLGDTLALARRGIAADAVVLRADCAGRHGYRYAFQVAGHWIAGGVGGRCAGVQAGDRVAVTYLPENPAINSAGDLRQRRDTSLLLGAVVVLLFPLLLLLRLSQRLQRRHRPRRRDRAAAAGGAPR